MQKIVLGVQTYLIFILYNLNLYLPVFFYYIFFFPFNLQNYYLVLIWFLFYMMVKITILVFVFCV